MKECEYVTACPFFLDKMSGTAELIRNKYCRSNYEACARFIVRNAAGKDKVPADLYPHQIELCDKLMGK